MVGCRRRLGRRMRGVVRRVRRRDRVVMRTMPEPSRGRIDREQEGCREEERAKPLHGAKGIDGFDASQRNAHHQVMKQPLARTPEEYLAQQPADRRASLARVRNTILEHLPRGYEEAMAMGLITYQIPLSRYPDTYNGHPLWVAALGAHKSYLTLYLMSAAGDNDNEKRLRDGFRSAGKKLDMGKSCIHFQTADDLALDAVGDVIANTSVDRFLAMYESVKRKSPPKKRKAAR